MGLSNSERLAKIAYAINRINNEWNNVKGQLHAREQAMWQPVIDGFWHTFFASNGLKGGYSWLFGSTLTADCGNDNYLPHIAMAEHTDKEDFFDTMEKENIEELTNCRT